MRRKRINSVIAVVLAMSMIFGSNVSAFGEEVSQNTAEENVTEAAVSEDITIPQEQEVSNNTEITPAPQEEKDEQKEAVSDDSSIPEVQPELIVSQDSTTEDTVSNDTVSNDMVSEDGAVSENTVLETDEAAGGTATAIKLYISGNTVSYNGKKQTYTLSANVTDGYTFVSRMISTNGTKDPSQYTESEFSDSKSTSENITVTKAKKEFTVSAVNAGWYAVSVNAIKDGKISANALAFISINKAAEISISINGSSKYYDGAKLEAAKAGNKPYEINGKSLYYNELTKKNDLDLVSASGDLTDAGEKYIYLDVSKISGNYAKVTVSAGKLTVLSTNLVIRSKDFRKNYDKKRVTDAERKGIRIESPNSDVKTLSANLKLTVDDFTWDQTSLISGDEVTVSQNKFVLNSLGKDKINSNNGKNFASVSLVSGNITVVKHNWTSNGLTAPVISSVKMNNKGWVTINWKPAKTYRDKNNNKTADEKKKNQARYMVYRYDDVNEDWILLNGNNATKDSVKASDREFGQTGRSFIDKQAGREANSTYIYKVNVIGYDENLNYGMAKEASYKACAPVPLTLSTKQHDNTSLDFQISKIRGAKSYVIEKSLTGKKDSFDSRVSVSADKINETEYSGTKLVSAKTYNDKGGFVTKGVRVPAEAVYYTDKNLTARTFYYYRAYVQSSVTEFSEDGAVKTGKVSVESDLSTVMRAKCTPYPPNIISVGSLTYNEAAIAFERLSEDIIPIGTSDSGKYKYQILRSTSPDRGYGVVKTFTGKQLDGDIENLTEVSANTEISLNGVKYKTDTKSYIYTFNNLRPEYTYYFKVRVICNGVTGDMSDHMSVTPMMDDVKSISANSSNYNQVTVSTNYVTGAKQMVITYRAVKDYSGKTLDVGSTVDSKWKSRTFPIKYDKNKQPITEFIVPGLKHGYTYVFYAEPKNGKKHITKNPKTAQAYTRVAQPVVKTSPKDLDEIYVQWESIAGATTYNLKVYDVEDSNRLVFDEDFKKAGKHTWKGGSNGKLDGKANEEDMDLAGKPYKFVVTATRKDKFFPNGQEGPASEPKTDAGRPTAVKNLKVAVNKVGEVYYPDGYLTWAHSADFSQKSPLTYMIERKVYAYKAGTKNSFETGFTESSILTYQDAYKKLTKANGKYVSYTNYRSKEKNKFNNGDRVVYVVTPVYYSDATKNLGRGQNKDGYILGVPKEVTYILPAQLIIASNTEVTVGDTATVSLAYRPTSTTIKNVIWTATSDGSKYFTWNGANVTGKAAMSNWNTSVYVQATSPVNGITSNKGYIKVNAKATPTGSGLKVCIDAGHGGSDSGATYNGMLEKSCNLDMAYAMKAELEAYGVPVVMTRYDDTYISVGDRPNIAYSNGCNLFISIHCNSGGASGTEVWKSITSYHDDAMASKILSNVTSAIGTGSRGVKTRTGSNGDYYGVIRGSAAKGIVGMIVEVAFMDGDYSKLNNSTNRANAGRAIADAILESKGYK